ncbi:MAG: peptide-methionine (S)-S-oxide reductase MsrA [Bacteroidia bacterium]|nr:peptide-methionine (S)-S-oxide reductase MsrA [Bacteroidia bacterium]MDW8157352.1 peptide-methionine (S)-S-oxide reductase MsrA [Bacteroidia bacterium]
MNSTKNSEKITLGGGCFWCIEAAFLEIEGVKSVISGYAGGKTPNPTYKEVCSGNTEHAEVCQIEFTPQQISCKEILEIFFSIHDPTTLNRQGADVGTQYRSIILYHTPEQKEIAQNVIQELEQQKIFNAPIVTQLQPLDKFYPAEEYHQNYYARNPYQMYCQVVIAPKLEKLRQKYAHRIKSNQIK